MLRPWVIARQEVISPSISLALVLKIKWPDRACGLSLRSSIGGAKYWSYLGCKFESYLEQKGGDEIGKHE